MAAPAAVPGTPAVLEGEPSLWPTRKWLVAQVAAGGTFFGALIESGWELNSTLQIMLIGIVVQAITTWLVPNAQTIGGVPLKHSRS